VHSKGFASDKNYAALGETPAFPAKAKKIDRTFKA
jgi:hypothetical protein